MEMPWLRPGASQLRWTLTTAVSPNPTGLLWKLPCKKEMVSPTAIAPENAHAQRTQICAQTHTRTNMHAHTFTHKRTRAHPYASQGTNTGVLLLWSLVS